MPRRPPSPSIFDAETRVLELDSTLLSLSDDDSSMDATFDEDLEPPSQIEPLPRIGETTVRAMGSDPGRHRVRCDIYPPLTFSQVMTAEKPSQPVARQPVSSTAHEATVIALTPGSVAFGSNPPAVDRESTFVREPETSIVEAETSIHIEETRVRIPQAPEGPHIPFSAMPEPTVLAPPKPSRKSQPRQAVLPPPAVSPRALTPPRPGAVGTPLHPPFEAAPESGRTELRPSTVPAGPYCAVSAPTLAAYQITREIASGGMGIVYEGYHRQSGQRVAVKYMRDVSAQKAKLVKRFLGEGIAASRIDHPGVVEVYDFGHDNEGVPFLVMEFLDGENLGKRLERGPITPHEFMAIARQLTDILVAAHKRGIVHRDIKPDNIFLIGGDANRVKLLDFGVAKFLNDRSVLGSTTVGQVLGTPFYMSPEQCTGTDVDQTSDIYSLGCVFYQMIAGRVPFPGTIFDVILGHRQGTALPLATLANVPPSLIALVDKMMSKRPVDRFANVEAVALALLDVASGKAAISDAPERAHRPRRRHGHGDTRVGIAAQEGRPRKSNGSVIILVLAALVLLAAAAMTVSLI